MPKGTDGGGERTHDSAGDSRVELAPKVGLARAFKLTPVRPQERLCLKRLEKRVEGREGICADFTRHERPVVNLRGGRERLAPSPRPPASKRTTPHLFQINWLVRGAQDEESLAPQLLVVSQSCKYLGQSLTNDPLAAVSPRVTGLVENKDAPRAVAGKQRVPQRTLAKKGLLSVSEVRPQ
jgi:hypothetical protein